MNINQFKLSFRNVTRQGKRSTLLGLAMGFGVMITATVSSLTTGMASSAVENFSQVMGGHVYISGEVVSDSGRSLAIIEDQQAVNDSLAELSNAVEGVYFRSSTRGTLAFGSTSISSMISGVQFDNETTITESMVLIAGSFDNLNTAKTLLIPEKVATELNVTAGDSIYLKASTITGQQNLVEWSIGAVIENPEGFDLVTVYASLADVNQLLALSETEYQQVNISLNDLSQMDAIRDQLKDYFAQHANLKVEDEEDSGPMGMMTGMMANMTEVVEDPWQGTRFDVTNLNDNMEEILALVGILEQVSNIVFGVILLIIMVGISNSYRMVIMERVQEIGTLRAMGAQRGWIFRLFVSESVMIAFLGALGGILMSLIMMALFGQVNVGNSGPMQMFSVAGYLQFPISFAAFAIPALITALIAALAVYSPARSAARMAPGDALRAAA